MNKINSIKKTSHEVLPSTRNSDYFPYDEEGNLVLQHEGGIYTGISENIGILIEHPNEYNCIKNIQLSVTANDSFMLINVILNSIDIENSVTVSFKSYFLSSCSADIKTPESLAEAVAFLNSLYLGHNQTIMIQTLLYGLVGKLLFHKVTKLPTVALALVKSMVEQDRLNTAPSDMPM